MTDPCFIKWWLKKGPWYYTANARLQILCLIFKQLMIRSSNFFKSVWVIRSNEQWSLVFGPAPAGWLAFGEGVVPSCGARGGGGGLRAVAQRVEHAQHEPARSAQPPLQVTCNKQLRISMRIGYWSHTVIRKKRRLRWEYDWCSINSVLKHSRAFMVSPRGNQECP